MAFAARHLRSSRVLWLFAWRDVEAEREPARDLIARIARDSTVLPLRRLSAHEAGELIDELAHDAPAGLRGTLLRATSGNPLFLVETLACLAARGTKLPADLGQLPLAQGVAAVVRERIAPLSPAARRALEAASILGRDFELDPWAEASDMPPALLRQRAAEIVESGILAECGPLRWSFSHELVREAICRQVPEELVRAGHRRVALALDRRVQAGEPELSGERAHHGLAALGALDARVLLDWAIAASDHARAQCAYAEAFTVLERAAAALGPLARKDAALLLAIGRSRSDLRHVPAAREALLAAIEIARASGDARMCAHAVLAFGSRYVLGDIHEELVALIDDANAALSEKDRDLTARLLARKAAALTPAARPEKALAMAREALRVVADSADVRAQLDVAVAAGSAFGDFAPVHR